MLPVLRIALDGRKSAHNSAKRSQKCSVRRGSLNFPILLNSQYTVTSVVEDDRSRLEIHCIPDLAN
jgi:hypothetical protein